MSDTEIQSISILAFIEKLKIPHRMVIVITLLTISMSWISVATAGEISFAEFSQSEQWVSTQLAEGKPADLSKYKGSDRISSRFLVALLIGDKRFKTHNNGILIDNAVITGKLNLPGAVVPYMVSITNSIFQDEVVLSSSVFRHDLILDGSLFSKDASFASIQVERDVSFQGTSKSKTIFNGQADFSGAHIGRLFLANGASFNNSGSEAASFFQGEFDNSKKDVRSLCEAILRDRYELQTEKPCGNTTKDTIEWLNELLQSPDLHERIKTKKHLSVTEEIKILKKRTDKYLKQPLKSLSDDQKETIKRLNRLTIEITYPQETPKRIVAFFTALETGHNVHLDGASFKGPVDFRSATIGRSFYGDYTNFQDIANFSGLKVLGKKTTFISANFHGPFYLDKADIAGDLIITEDASFEGPVSFYGTTIGADLRIEKTVLNKLNASNITVKGPATFSNVTINTSATFQNSNFNTLALEKVTWPHNEILGDSADFDSKEFESLRDVKSLCEALKNDGIKLDLMTAPEGTIDWLNEILKSKSLFGEVVDNNPHLTMSKEIMKLISQTKQYRRRSSGELNDKEQMAIKQLNRLMLELAYPLETPKRGLSIDGLTYRELSVTSGSKIKPGLFSRLLRSMNIRPSEERPEVKLLEKSRFNIQNYIQLESFFKRSGHEDWADEVYIKGRQQELENKKPWEVGDYLTYVFWDKLAGFGRRPFRIIYVSIMILLVGATVFSPKYFDPEFKSKWGLPENEGNSSTLNILFKLRRVLLSFAVRIGLSLDVFVPTHHPGLLDHWSRSVIPTWVLVYYYFHKFCGMILVPIAAAAFFTHLRISG